MIDLPVHILIVEDDLKLAAMLKDYLRGEGYNASAVHMASKALSEIKSNIYSLAILDIMLPDFDGFELCRKIRSTSDVPLIMLTAKGEPLDRIIGLELGADDYLSKPFEPRELLARIKAILRRGQAHLRSDRARHEQLIFGRLVLITSALSAYIGDKKCQLTPYQFQILSTLAQTPGRIVSRDSLMNTLKGHNLNIFDRSIDVHISRIRAEIEDDPKNPKRILTVRGAGYVFAAKQD